MKLPEGKGAFLYRLWRCGPMKDLAKALHDDGYSWAIMKVANGMSATDGSSSFNPALVDELAVLLRMYGIQVWVLHYVYGMRTDNNQPMPLEEVAAISHWIERLSPDGLVIDAESEYKKTSVRLQSDYCAETYCGTLKGKYPDLTMGLCSYRFPDSHTTFPWAAFLKHVDVHMPQVYWIKATNPAEQLVKSTAQLMARKPLPIVPWGPAYLDGTYSWRPTVAQIDEFDAKAHELELPGVAWFLWDTGIDKYPEYREAIRAHVWETEDPLWAQLEALTLRVIALEGGITYLDGRVKTNTTAIDLVSTRSANNKTWLEKLDAWAKSLALK